MFSFGRGMIANGAHFRALRELFVNFYQENSPDARGRRLLREWLSPQQRAQFDDLGYFDVIGCHTGARYRIYSGSVSNVDQIDGSGRAQTTLCFIPEGSLVTCDVMLAQKVGLETDEMAVLAIANRFAPRAPSRLACWRVRRAH